MASVPCSVPSPASTREHAPRARTLCPPSRIRTPAVLAPFSPAVLRSVQGRTGQRPGSQQAPGKHGVWEKGCTADGLVSWDAAGGMQAASASHSGLFRGGHAADSLSAQSSLHLRPLSLQRGVTSRSRRSQTPSLQCCLRPHRRPQMPHCTRGEGGGGVDRCRASTSARQGTQGLALSAGTGDGWAGKQSTTQHSRFCGRSVYQCTRPSCTDQGAPASGAGRVRLSPSCAGSQVAGSLQACPGREHETEMHKSGQSAAPWGRHSRPAHTQPPCHT